MKIDFYKTGVASRFYTLLNMKLYCLFIIALFIISCEEEVHFNFEHEPKLTLNCILNPDSTIKMNLTLSQSINSKEKNHYVDNAHIMLYEGNILLGVLISNGNGIYALNHKPKPHIEYRVVVKTVNYQTLFASTYIPEAPDVDFDKEPLGADQYGIDRYNMHVKLHDYEGNDHYWLYRVFKVNNRKDGGNSISINAPFVDDFNRITDTEERYGFRHFLALRISDEGYDGQSMEFVIPDLAESLGYHAQKFMNADKHYDKYLKTSILNRMKETSELPFFEPVQIYSNIENGYGIFGSCAITTIEL